VNFFNEQITIDKENLLQTCITSNEQVFFSSHLLTEMAVLLTIMLVPDMPHSACF